MAKIVTITNPLTGQSAQVDQLDHTAQQIDDGLNIARGVSNPNLLDNWYFGNPVDQKQGRIVKPNTTYYSDNQLTTAAGTTGAYVTAYRYAPGTASGVSYASFKLTDSDTAPTYYAAPENVVRGYAGAGYGIDRWVLDNDSGNATILLTESGLKFVNGSSATGVGAINQKLPPELYSALAGKTVTLSILGKSSKSQQVLFFVNGAVFAVNSSAGGNNARLTTLTATLPQTINNFSIYVYGASEAGVGEGYTSAAKLELGSQQTLAHQENGNWVLNEIPDYGEQLARCQRYQINLVRPDEPNYGVIGTGYAPPNSDFAAIFIPTPITLREKPSIEKSGVFKLMQGYTMFDVTSMDTDRITNNGVVIFAHISGNTLSGEYMLYHWSDAMNTFLLNSNL